MSERLIFRTLGRCAYAPTWQAMREFTDRRDARTVDEVWLLEHPPVYTQGQAGRPEHVLAPGDIPVIQTDRGGQVTYHGPGQLIVYPLLDLERRGLGVRRLVHLLEQTVIDLVAAGGRCAERRTGAPGVYVDGAKLASIGIRVRRGCSYHGLALNVSVDLEPFSRINPCGFSGQPMLRFDQLIAGATVEKLGPAFARRFAGLLEAAGFEFDTTLPADLRGLSALGQSPLGGV